MSPQSIVPLLELELLLELPLELELLLELLEDEDEDASLPPAPPPPPVFSLGSSEHPEFATAAAAAITKGTTIFAYRKAKPLTTPNLQVFPSSSK